MKLILSSYQIVIQDIVLDILNNYKQNKAGHHEAGGIILGQIIEEEIHLQKLSIPTIFDKSSRTSFDRNKDIAQIIINHEFANSAGKTIYLGEWHTHPENFPSPSTQDYIMIKDQFHTNKLNTDFIILIIKGMELTFLGVFNGKQLLQTNI